MEYKQLQQYVDKYIKNFLPFKNEKAFQSIVNVLSADYFPQVYQNIPKRFKDYVEDQKINSSLYDVILISIGYPEKLITSLRPTQKLTIIQNLMDYHKYSGTVKYITKVCENFKENFNVYELYADYRMIVDENLIVKYDWVMIPRSIYKVTDTQYTLYDYDKIYNDTPTYFLSKIQLEVLRRSQSLPLPFKTNLFLLDMQSSSSIDEMSQLINAATFYYFKDLFFNLNFNNENHTITINHAYQLWYYILYKFSDKVFSPDLGNQGPILLYNLGSATFPYTLDPGLSNSIDTILDEYNNLNISRKNIETFYNTVFDANFKTSLYTTVYNLDDFRKRIMSSIGDELIKIVDSLFSQTDKKSTLVLELLGSIYDSLKLYISESGNPIISKYQDNLLNMFPPLLIDPKLTATYQLLTTFKPFHTQFIAQAEYKATTSESKLNNALIEDEIKFVIHDYESSSPVISDDFQLSHSVESGYFNFDNTDKILTDLNGAVQFVVGDLIFSRNIYTNEFPIDKASRIISINRNENTYEFKLEFPYQGPIGVFSRAYKIYPPAIQEMITLDDGFFSFTNVGNANIVITSESGFMRFNIGDYIHSPEDNKEYAVQIIQKDYNTLSFILADDYFGTAGSWSQAGRWRPAS